MKRRKNYESPASLQQVEVLLELAFLDGSTFNDGARNGGIFSNYQEEGESVTYSSKSDAWID